MTDEEIVKAFECCNDNYSCPADCPLYEDDRDCLSALNKPVLNLINRQKAEIESLKDILYDADGVNLVNYWHQQCKIAENGCRNFEEENKKLKAEIERLKESRDRWRQIAEEFDRSIKENEKVGEG